MSCWPQPAPASTNVWIDTRLRVAPAEDPLLAGRVLNGRAYGMHLCNVLMAIHEAELQALLLHHPGVHA